MARITVEDCLEHVDNRFELVLLATKRARQLAFGTAEPLVEWENDKPTVVALREIATGDMNEETIKAAALRVNQPLQHTQYAYADQFAAIEEDLTLVETFKEEDK